MKTKHDPRTILKIIEKHKTHAQTAAKEFAEAMKPGGELDVESESFDQGVLKTTETDTNSGIDSLAMKAEIDALLFSRRRRRPKGKKLCCSPRLLVERSHRE